MDFLSHEQKHILTEVKSGKNVVVDACAGSGKTTLILYTAKELNRRKFLQMTYNSMLRHEVNDRVKKTGVKNMVVHTFHSLAVKYYYSTAYTDRGIRYIMLQDLPPKQPIDRFDVLVIDEAQDMTFLYFLFVSKMIRDMGSPIQLLILGDYMQGLYEFKGADTRFLTLADKIWQGNPALKSKVFSSCTMKMSYRITNTMCQFINRALLNEDRMEACREGPPVIYASHNSQNLERMVLGEIYKILENGGQPQDIFILGASVKGLNSKIRSLENALVERGIPCHVPVLESDTIDERVIHKKVVFSTFHTVKGRERNYVFVVGFDNSYFVYNARTSPRDCCPNTLYVACSRAKKALYVLEQNQYRGDRPLEFLHLSHHDMMASDFVQFRGLPRSNFFVDPDAEQREAELVHNHMLTPSELIKFLSESVIEEISGWMDKIFITETDPASMIEFNIPNLIETRNGFFEEVSDLNGIAIPCMYYDSLEEAFAQKEEAPSSSQNILYSIIYENIAAMKPEKHSYLKSMVETLPASLDTIQDYLYVANISLAVQERLYSRLKQIDREEYTWITEDMYHLCKTRLRTTVGADCQLSRPQIEKTLIHQSNAEQHIHIDTFLKQHFEPHNTFRFTARMDVIGDKFLWELKCTHKLSIDHLLQVVIYAWLWQMLPENIDSPLRVFKIMNIRTGEIQRLEATREEINTIMVALLKSKFLELHKKTDAEFIQDCISGNATIG
jgi:AAA domain/UvrD-like helicase C-terminal domain